MVEGVQVITDPNEVKELLKKGTVTDINAFIKNAARNNPDLVKDPEAFEKQWETDKARRAVEDFKVAEPERIGTKRAELEDVLEKHGIELADAYDKLSDKQKAYGKITSKLSFAISIDEIEKIFTWAEIEFGQLSWKEKCLSLFQAAELIGTTPANYRGIRKIFLAIVEGNTLEVKPEDLRASTKAESVQKAVGAKLLKTKDNGEVEECWNWAEVELQKQLMTLDKYIVFFQIAEMIPLTEDHYKTIRKIFVRMNKD
jgi:hypothetical protein